MCKMRRIVACFFALVFLFCGCAAPKAQGKIKIVATVFSAYDFARAVAGGDAEVSMLLSPGTEIHSFEPTAEDIIAIENADIFIYTGGDSDVWVDRILGSIDISNKKIIRMVDKAKTLIYEEHADHGHTDHNHSDSPDEHVWLSPDNAKSIISAICRELCAVDSKNSAAYKERAESYCRDITLLDGETRDTIAAAKYKTLVVADRFPLKYLCAHYGLEAVAAFDACDHFVDADAKTVLKLIETVNQEKLSFVFYLENGSGYLADTVCRETGAEKIVINSMHTISREDFGLGITYIDIMRQNKEALERGLN
ncbi:MAG: zinc ABC transporter substrate-binding protein [Ruminococcaceae bacterium]|nr:zinc ABC transporter substrate-binding protein [Oscillospiraceae bacterium]